MIRLPLRALLSAVASLALAAEVRAQEESTEPPAEERSPAPEPERAVEMDALVVTAARREAPLFESPFSMSRVTMDDIQRQRLRRTTTDALLDLPSVMVQKTAYGQASPFIRGFTGYQTVMLVDGIRLNNSTFRSGPNQYWSTVDVFTVQDLEVVRGPASVLYGSDAVGGAVNAVARRRTEFEPGSHGSVRAIFRAATAERSFTERLEGEGNVDDLGVFAGVTFKDYEDLTAGKGSGELPGTGYREKDADLRLDYRVDPATTWTLGLQHVRQSNVPRTETTVEAVSFHGTVLGTELKRDLDQARDLAYARLAALDAGTSFADRFEATLSWHRQAEEQDRDRTAGRTEISFYEAQTLGLQAQAVKKTAAGTLTYGVEYWRDRVRSSRKDYVNGVQTLEAIQGPVADDATYDLAGAYVQDEIPLGAGTLIPGARFTYAAAHAEKVDDPTVAGNDPATPGNTIDLRDSWSNVVGSLRTVQPLGEDWNAFGGVSQAFRAPNLSDLTRLDDTSGVETPSPGLDPEKYLSAEAGVRHRGRTWTLQAAAWHTWIDGMIVPSPTGALIGPTPEVRKDNVGDGWVHGVEAEATWHLSRDWDLSGAGSWSRGEVDQLTPAGMTVREPLSRVMPLTGALTLWYAPPRLPWNAWLSGRAAAEQDELSLKDETDTRRIPPGGTPGYAVVSFGAGYEISEHARIAAALENVFNKDYRIHGSGVNEPGRNLVVSLELSF